MEQILGRKGRAGHDGNQYTPNNSASVVVYPSIFHPKPNQSMSNFIAPGSTAPTLQVTDQEGTAKTLSDFNGKKLVVFFYPKANSGSCTKEAVSLKDAYPELQSLGYEVVGVSPDKTRALQNFINKHELPYSLLSDPNNELTKAFGAWGEKKMYGKVYDGLLRTTFLLDEKGVVTHVIEKVKSATHGDQVLEAIKA